MNYRNLFVATAVAGTAAFTLACNGTPAEPTPPGATRPGGVEAVGDPATLKVTAPVPVSPTGGAEIEDLDPDLVIQNATGRFVENLSLSYVFAVFDSSNRLVYQSAPVPQGADGRTTHEIAEDLNADEVHTWRAYAVYQGRQGPTSAGASFKTLNRYGESCAHTGSPLGIVNCRVEQHGGMDHEEQVQFLREVAYDLNQLGISDKGGFGLLIKTVGNNCLGYSCDIICEGHGDDQNQYDILVDDQYPGWSEVSEVTVRPCEIIQ